MSLRRREKWSIDKEYKRERTRQRQGCGRQTMEKIEKRGENEERTGEEKEENMCVWLCMCVCVHAETL